MTVEEKKEQIQHLRSEWIKAQRHHEELSKQYTRLLQELEDSRNKMASLEKERLDLERSMMEVKKIPAASPKTRKPKSNQDKIRLEDVVLNLSQEERANLIRLLGA